MSYIIFVLVPLALSLGSVLRVLYGLLVNYNPARKTGLLLIVLPVDCGNPLWLIIDRKIMQLIRRIPFSSGTFTWFNWRGWEIVDRYRAHQQLGDAILFVTPGENYLSITSSCVMQMLSQISFNVGQIFFSHPNRQVRSSHILSLGTLTKDY